MELLTAAAERSVAVGGARRPGLPDLRLWDALLGSPSATGTLHCWTGSGFEAATWAEVVADAHRCAGTLRAAGVGEGSRVACVLTNGPDVVRGMLGVWAAGGAVASLPVPARAMGVEEYGAQLIACCERLRPDAFLIDEQLLGLLPDELRRRVPVRTWASLRGGPRVEASPPPADALAFVQYSSGSTATPKGCMLTPAAIGAQLEILADMAEAEPGGERVVCWLPLSHDMGTFGCLLFAMAWGFDLALSAPERFMQAPRTWFGDAAEFGATLSAGTSSALHFATRAHRVSRLTKPIKLTTCVIGAERIEWSTLEAAGEVLGPYGLDVAALMPGYGLAENTLVVSAGMAMQPRTSMCVDTVALADGEVREVAPDGEAATRIVSTGVPCRDVEVRVGEPGRLSEICVASPSLSSGYLGDSERTGERFRDGVFRTGDLGYLHGGELYVVGRADDVLSIGGRNVYAREIEAAVGELEAVRSGCCTIVDASVDGRRRLTMLLELRHPVDDPRAIAAAAGRIANAKAGVDLDECVLLEKGALPKTPSGKIQRFRCRQLLMGEQLAPVARVPVR